MGDLILHPCKGPPYLVLHLLNGLTGFLDLLRNKLLLGLLYNTMGLVKQTHVTRHARDLIGPKVTRTKSPTIRSSWRLTPNTSRTRVGQSQVALIHALA
jgi:hypothetical protein